MEVPLVPPGNAFRPRALVPAALGFAALVLLFCSDAHFSLTVPLAALFAAIAGFGALDFAGCFDDVEPARLGVVTLKELRPRVVEAAVTLLLWVLVLRLAVAGVLPRHAVVAPVAVTALSAASLAALGRVALVWSAPGTLLRHRPGFWLLLLGILLYVPLAGSYSLLDPWETHYGEVTREMLARDDWLSFWWAQEDWFWSKPALDFWLQGIFFSLLGVNFAPDQVLSAAARGALPQPEWAARMPIVLLSLVAVYTLYRFVQRAAGARAGFLSGLVLLCAPYWSILAHQSMTDMPYVAPLTAALALFGLALLAEAEETVPSLELAMGGRVLRLSAFHALFGLVLLSTLPQLAYLLTRHLTLQIAAPPYGFRWHWDEFFSGSGMGNCGLPGNDACRRGSPTSPVFQPFVGAAIFGAALGYLLFLNRGERRKKRLYYIAAWYFTALAALGKGAPGLVLPLVVAAAVLVARRDWAELTRTELASLGLVFAAVCLPWYVQEYMRHGEGFTDRLLFHDMYKRAFVHVHDTNVGTDTSLRYYIWQLGYGLFPWTGLALCGLGVTINYGRASEPRQRDFGLLLALWLTMGFALFTLSLTKFHHYALPCAPPLAVGAALLLDRALRKDADPTLGVLAVCAALVTLLVARDLSTSFDGDVPASARLLHLVTYNYKRSWPKTLNFESVQGWFGVVAAGGLLLWLVPRLRRSGALVLGAAGACFCAFTLWVYLPALAPHFGQRELFLAYYRARRGPEEPIAAFQMNWKGENFYSGNRLPAFVTTGAKFQRWLKQQRKAGTKVLYLVSEHARLGGLKLELGSGYRITPLTDKVLNDKFTLVRAELLPEPAGAGE